MAKTTKRATGDLGEQIACKYLETKGFRIVEQNYLRKWGEIDIVSKKDEVWHFVEVKTVTVEDGGGSRGTGGYKVRPEERVHEAKLQRLHRAMQTYLMEKRLSMEVEWSLDVICVYLNQEHKTAHVEMIENVVG